VKTALFKAPVRTAQ